MEQIELQTSPFEKRLLRWLGGPLLNLSETIGRIAILTRQTIAWLRSAERPSVVSQMLSIGAESMPVTILTSLFTGMVLALQTGYSFRKGFNEPIYVGTVVGLSLTKELGRVLTAVVVAARAGAAIAAEPRTLPAPTKPVGLSALGSHAL